MLQRLFASDRDDDRPFWQQRTWQISAGFFAFLLIAFLVMTISGGLDEEDAGTVAAQGGKGAGARAAQPGPLSSSRTDRNARPAGCVTDDSDQSAPLRPPADLTWKTLNGGRIPMSPTVGPLRTKDPMLWCFARTPMGAVMAAYVIPRQLSGDNWRTVAYEQMVDNIGRSLFLSMRESLPENRVQTPTIRIIGFQLVSYTPDAATVRLLLAQDSTYGVTDYKLAFDNGDWKLKPLNVGDLYTPVKVVTSTAGFIMWEQ